MTCDCIVPSTPVSYCLSMMTLSGDAVVIFSMTDGDNEVIFDPSVTITGVPPLYWLTDTHPWDGPTDEEIEWYLANVIE